MIGAIIPDLVISDVDLPGISGFELLDRLLRHPAARVAVDPVLLMSAGANRAEAARRGVPYLAKPFDLGDAHAAIHRPVGLPPPGEVVGPAAHPPA